ncbi:MAG: HAD-IA family hydrolase [Pseudomonadota bacterium]|nr:HAD-IA family hydrolase [Pseudomonadota bacterium]
MSRIRAITFDLDDTLWAVTPVLIEAEASLLGFLSARAPQITAVLETGGLRQVRERVLAEEPGLIHAVSALRRRTIEAALLDVGLAARQASSLAEEAFDHFLHARHQVQYFPDALETLELLAGRYQLGVLTNGNADVHRLGIGHLFRVALCAEDLGASKPHPALFEAALEALGCAPHEAVHVGDHHEHDIAGAAAVGMHTIWINHGAGGWPGGPPPGRQVHQLADLPAAVEALEDGLGPADFGPH